MEKVKSISLQSMGVNLEKIGDFLYHEGPLLSLYKDRNNQENYYFYKWTDCDGEHNRWLVFLVKKENLRRFLFEEITLKQLIIELNTYVFLIDINDDLEASQYLIVSTQDIPQSYLPKDTSFYKQENYSELAKTVKENILIETDSIYQALSYLATEISNLKEEQRKVTNFISNNSNVKFVYPEP
jgi:hypothetical protein